MLLNKSQTNELVKDLKQIQKMADAAARWGAIEHADNCEIIVKLTKKYLKILTR